MSKIYPVSRDMAGQWFVKFFIPAYKGTTQRAIKVYVPRLATAAARMVAAQKIVADVVKNGYVPSPRKKKLGFSGQLQLLFDLLETKKVGIARKTWFAYKTHLDHLNQFCEAQNVTVMTTATALAFLESLRARGLNPTTINSHRSTLRGFYAVLKKKRQVYQNPFLDTTKYKEARQGAKWFQVNQQAVLKATIKRDAPFLWLPVQYLYYCFIRPIELGRLTVSDVNLAEGTINIPADKSKNKKNQFVVIPAPLLLQLVDAKIQDYPPQYFLVGRDGLPSADPLPQNYLTRHHKKLTDALKYPPRYSLYSWKHTGVAMAYKAGVGIRELQLQLRHHSLDMVTVYMRSLGIADLPDLKDKFPEL